MTSRARFLRRFALPATACKDIAKTQARRQAEKENRPRKNQSEVAKVKEKLQEKTWVKAPAKKLKDALKGFFN